jgi:hypothetical protein
MSLCGHTRVNFSYETILFKPIHLVLSVAEPMSGPQRVTITAGAASIFTGCMTLPYDDLAQFRNLC